MTLFRNRGKGSKDAGGDFDDDLDEDITGLGDGRPQGKRVYALLYTPGAISGPARGKNRFFSEARSCPDKIWAIRRKTCPDKNRPIGRVRDLASKGINRGPGILVGITNFRGNSSKLRTFSFLSEVTKSRTQVDRSGPHATMAEALLADLFAGCLPRLWSLPASAFRTSSSSYTTRYELSATERPLETPKRSSSRRIIPFHGESSHTLTLRLAGGRLTRFALNPSYSGAAGYMMCAFPAPAPHNDSCGHLQHPYSPTESKLKNPHDKRPTSSSDTYMRTQRPAQQPPQAVAAHTASPATCADIPSVPAMQRLVGPPHRRRRPEHHPAPRPLDELPPDDAVRAGRQPAQSSAPRIHAVRGRPCTRQE
ncbi:hypothetical protein B0H17DRAFT_1224062 [Mycena rosella]|uniref:Uncharacterized protein n=1 Tax=Mycena rosella TaxID=1033263 RepID=A0AAD7H3F4_MYCRO|nr:hypothetical protein B0H17DRAFT_1224062 [Mycena rosella]